MDEYPLLSGSTFLFCGGVGGKVGLDGPRGATTPGLALMSYDSKIPHESAFPILTKIKQQTMCRMMFFLAAAS